MDEVGDIGDVGADDARWRKRRHGVNGLTPASLYLGDDLAEYCDRAVALW